MMPRYEIETKYGKIFVTPFNLYLDTILIEGENATMLDIKHNGRKYSVRLIGSFENGQWIVFTGCQQIEPKYEKYTDVEAVAEMSAMAYFEGYFTEILQNWVRNHPTEMQQSRKAQDQEAINARMSEIETLELEIKKIRSEIAQIMNGNHLPTNRVDMEIDED
jgi:hypothetical protein